MRGHSLPPRRRPKARQLLRIPKQRPAAPGEIQAEPRITTSRPESLSKMKTRQHTSLLYAILMSCTSTCLSYERSPILIYRQMPVLWTHLSWSTAHMPILWTHIYPDLQPASLSYELTSIRIYGPDAHPIQSFILSRLTSTFHLLFILSFLYHHLSSILLQNLCQQCLLSTSLLSILQPISSLQSFSTKRYGYFLPIFSSPSPPHPYLCSNIQFLSPKRRAPLLAPLLYIPILVLIFNFSLPNAGLLSLFQLAPLPHIPILVLILCFSLPNAGLLS